MTLDAHDALRRYREAMVAMDADALADLYAEDAVHEFPFEFPGMPERHVGRDAIRQAYRAAWSRSDARPDRVLDVAIHETDGGETLVVEQIVTGRMKSTGAAFDFPGVLVLTVRGGAITRVRDYLDGVAIARSSGRLAAVLATPAAR